MGLKIEMGVIFFGFLALYELEEEKKKLTFIFCVPKMPKKMPEHIFHIYINLWATKKFGFHHPEFNKNISRIAKRCPENISLVVKVSKFSY